MKSNKIHIKCAVILVLAFFCIVKTFAQETKQKIQWKNYEEAVGLAEQDPRKIMLFMEADWCSLCKKMKKEVFPDSEIRSLLNNEFYPVSIDIESDEKITFDGQEWTKKGLSQELGLYATPTFIFLETDQKAIGNRAGFMDIEEFKKLLELVLKENYQEPDS